MEIWVVSSDLLDSFQKVPEGEIFLFLDFVGEHVNKIGDYIFDDIFVASLFLILNDSLEAQTVRLDQLSRD